MVPAIIAAGNMAAAMDESEELKLLRTENAKLKKLAGGVDVKEQIVAVIDWTQPPRF